MLQKVVYGKTGGKAMGLNAQMNIFLCDSLIQEYDDRLSSLSRTRNLTSKQMNGELEEINWSYNQEERLLRNDMNLIEDKTSDEYKELMAELQELQDEKSEKTTHMSNEIHDKDASLELEQSTIETSRSFVQKTRDGLQEILDSHVERSGYFTGSGS